jgi:hypothetical protein
MPHKGQGRRKLPRAAAKRRRAIVRRVFVSYASHDAAIAAAVVGALKGELGGPSLNNFRQIRNVQR